MRPAPSRFLQRLSDSLHPRPVLSEKESRNLVNRLKASFRKQFEDSQHDQSQHGPSGLIQTRPQTHVDRHIASLVSNPLLRPVSEPRAGSITIKAPIAIFEDCIARGNATCEIAWQCLKTQLQVNARLRAARSSDIRPARRRGSQDLDRLVHIILQWLWASGSANRHVFESHPDLARALVRRLAGPDRHRETLLQWIRSASNTCSVESGSGATTPQGFLLLAATHVWLKSHKADNALELYVRARVSILPEGASFKTRESLLRLSTLYLYDWLSREGDHTGPAMVLCHGHQARQHFKVFCEDVESFISSTDTSGLLHLAHMRLRYLGHATLDDALALVESIDIAHIHVGKHIRWTQHVDFLTELAQSASEHGTRQQKARSITLLKAVMSRLNDDSGRVPLAPMMSQWKISLEQTLQSLTATSELEAVPQ